MSYPGFSQLLVGEQYNAPVVDRCTEIHLEIEIKRCELLLADDHIVERVSTGRTGHSRRVLVGSDRLVVLAWRQRRTELVKIVHVRATAGVRYKSYAAPAPRY